MINADGDFCGSQGDETATTDCPIDYVTLLTEAKMRKLQAVNGHGAAIHADAAMLGELLGIYY